MVITEVEKVEEVVAAILLSMVTISFEKGKEDFVVVVMVVVEVLLMLT